MTDTRVTSARRAAGSSRGGRTDRAPAGSWPVRERSLIKPVLGIPPIAAVALAVGSTTLGVFVDLLRLGTVGAVFEAGYFLGCVLAVSWVRRYSIFVPAVQPPLLLAVVVPTVAVLIGAPSPQAGTAENLLMAGAPLINAFPAMAVTTAVVLLLAGFRLLRQRTGPDDAVGQLRRLLSGGHSDRATSNAGGPRDRASGRPAGRERARSGGSTASGRDRRPAPDGTGRTRIPGERTGTRGGSGRTAPRTGVPRASSTGGSARSEGPDGPRRPRRG